MRAQIRGLLLGAGLIFLMCVPAVAHHAFSAEFDRAKPFSLTGVITKVDWINPHTYIYMDIKDQDGKVVSWSFESMPPGTFHRAGLEKKMLPVGQTITVSGYLAKDGSKSLGWLKQIKFPDGRVIQITAENPDEEAK